MIRIMLDSGSDQNQALREAYDVEVVPMTIILGQDQYLDDEDFSLETLHAYMRQGKQPRTSQISPQMAIDRFEAAAKAGDDVIFISIFKQLSGTYQVAVNAMEDVKDRYPNFQGAVVDSRSAAGAGTILYLHGQELIKAGYDFDQVHQQLEQSAQELSVYLAVDDLDWLVKGGRLSKTVGKIGSLLKVKPFLSINDKGITKEGVVRGSDRVYTKMANTFLEEIDRYEGQYLIVSHVDRWEMAEKVRDYIIDQIGPVNIGIFEVSPVISCHVGLGGVGVFGYKKKPDLFEPVTFKS
ncbi:DegV domain-containing protein SAV1425 [Alloiococcus otitis]|uniref:DegV family EDD domain-containing protein n=1 Tax=Alloiococcus otitis ATCC 51267 TaxID=883081 RepID=K9E745_9LACT|nr:DegV family protein [Alloiococcus otitis]EKU92979.1 DegV family EDD domain-containing protein [Alloiococcus otitis ATCC 51267]SUU80841.1 DegV domain-containing protein SAV1425 [Alloiococcus otitis]